MYARRQIDILIVGYPQRLEFWTIICCVYVLIAATSFGEYILLVLQSKPWDTTLESILYKANCILGLAQLGAAQNYLFEKNDSSAATPNVPNTVRVSREET